MMHLAFHEEQVSLPISKTPINFKNLHDDSKEQTDKWQQHGESRREL